MSDTYLNSNKSAGARNHYESNVPAGRTLIIHPPYVHYENLSEAAPFIKDTSPFLPVGPLFAGDLLETSGAAEVEYFDCQLHDLRLNKKISEFDSVGIAVMGAQNIAPAYRVFNYLGNNLPTDRIYVGGQGVEKLNPAEFNYIFPGAHQVLRTIFTQTLGYMDVVICRQADKFSEADLRIYLSNELTLPFSQGCMFGCNFCGAQIQQREKFFDTRSNLEYLMQKAKNFGLTELDFYCTSLDFFQQALPGGNLALLIEKLESIIELREKFGIKLKLRALTRADSYNAAVRSEGILDLVKKAGFFKFGFGADGAASVELLRAMSKGTNTLRSEILTAFTHAQKNGFVPEILYVFGIPEDDEETLCKTKDLCVSLLEEFPSSQYRGFPAKNEIPGNLNWKNPAWHQSEAYQRLLTHPDLFTNLGFETLANIVSHQESLKRRLVNHFAVEMSYVAHELGRVQSYLTVPIMETDASELMDEATFELFQQIIKRYAPQMPDHLTPRCLHEFRGELNRLIPKDI
jgi:radical SAM superfamily enzyme YgiQ (UPF0313 family)